MSIEQKQSMKSVGILFPHQLFEENPLISACDTIFLVEEWLFFKQYHFHKQKIAFQRASMRFYADYLKKRQREVVYIDSFQELADIRQLIPHLKDIGVSSFTYIDTTDDWLETRIVKTCQSHSIEAKKLASPLFLNASEDLASYFSTKKRMFQTEFYIHQRKQRKILVDANLKPLGEKWSFDDENRLKYPKNKSVPPLPVIARNEFVQEAAQYTQTHFSTNYGTLDGFIYPTTFEESKAWLRDFFEKRFSEFGPYEDAIVAKESVLNHSVLTPMLNVGLLTPKYIVDEAMEYAQKHSVPLGSLEGFIRQIVGWREFIRAVYELKGTEERTKNYWGFTRKIPASFWNGTTGITPIDLTIKKILKTGYCHHIERLMVLGNFMLLCEFDPDEVYRWFMELFIDAYDWVMVPNVYGMSQFADGGLMATKPYISGSNYLMKMSDYPKGDWQTIWDGLFWRFMDKHRSFFLQNPRLGMLVNSFDKMPESKQQAHKAIAEKFLEKLGN